MKRVVLFIIVLIITCKGLQAQTEQTDTVATIPILKHGIGFSVGAFPLWSIDHPKDRWLIPVGELMPLYTFYEEFGDGQYEKMYHLGTYALNYNYNFNSKNSMGVSLAWMGIHIERHRVYYKNNIFYPINGSGWNHYWALMANYRNTYYHKNKVSMYWGIHFGGTLCLRDEKLLPKVRVSTGWFSSLSPGNFYDWNLHINAFGIDIGEEHILNMELGIGTFGIFRAGYKYKY